MTFDALHRPLGSLRLSVTDRCNLRCAYCMPEANYDWVPAPQLLTFEELDAVVGAFSRLGVKKVRLTGGEPLLRRELPNLVSMLAARGLDELALTTNGVLLRAQARALKDAGLQRLTVSLDTLDPERFRALTRRDSHAQVLDGLEAALESGFGGVKLDMVVMRGVNDDELVPMVEFARHRGVEVRFIEYMDVGGATRWSAAQVVSRAEILARLTQAMGPVLAVGERGSAPAERFRLSDGTVFGVIASTTAPFCGACDRARLTADGQLLTCLYAREGMDLRALVRSGASEAELSESIASRWNQRTDRGAENRKAMGDRRAALFSVSELSKAPLLEMHRRGG